MGKTQKKKNFRKREEKRHRNFGRNVKSVVLTVGRRRDLGVCGVLGLRPACTEESLDGRRKGKLNT